MSRYVISAFVAMFVVGLVSILAGGGLSFIESHVYDTYRDPEVGRALRPPNARALLTDAEVDLCRQHFFDIDSDLEYLGRRYFAVGSFAPGEDEYWSPKYSNVLCAMKEPLLSSPNVGNAKYRLLWMPSTPGSAVIRWELNGGHLTSYAVRMSSSDGSEAEIRIERELDRRELNRMRDALAEANFWELPTSRLSGWRDGSTWILEASEPDRYHVVRRNGGEEFYWVGRRMISLSGLSPDTIR